MGGRPTVIYHPEIPGSQPASTAGVPRLVLASRPPPGGEAIPQDRRGALRAPREDKAGWDIPAKTCEPLPVWRCLILTPLPGLSLTMNHTDKITRDEMIRLLNEDLAREFQAVIAYVVYSQTMKGAKFQAIAAELKKHAGEELSHALQIAKQIDYLNGTPVTVPKPVKLSDKAEDMLQFDLDNEAETIKAYRERIRQADAMGEFGLSEALRKIIAQEQEHLTDLADALGIDNPKLSD